MKLQQQTKTKISRKQGYQRMQCMGVALSQRHSQALQHMQHGLQSHFGGLCTCFTLACSQGQLTGCLRGILVLLPGCDQAQTSAPASSMVSAKNFTLCYWSGVYPYVYRKADAGTPVPASLQYDYQKHASFTKGKRPASLA